jgi:hypothetical protein
MASLSGTKLIAKDFGRIRLECAAERPRGSIDGDGTWNESTFSAHSAKTIAKPSTELPGGVKQAIGLFEKKRKEKNSQLRRGNAIKHNKSLSKPNQKILEPEPGLVLTLSNWYKTSSNLDVHLPEPGHLHFVQVHFTTDKIRPGSAKIFLSGT